MAEQPASAGLQQAQDIKLGQISTILQSGMNEEQKTAYAQLKAQEETNKELKKGTAHDNWMMKWTREQAKKALAMASKLKIDDIAKNMAAKATKFAGNLLDLLMKGLGLAALWALLDWISKQDWVALYEEHKANILKFWDALKAVGASVALWAGASWLIDGPIHKLWRSIKGIFGLGGKFATKAGHIAGWLLSGIFDFSKNALGKLWSGIKTIFGGAGKFFGMIATVTKWASHLMFDLTKGSLGLLWTAIKTVFAIGGTIATLAGKVGNWALHKMFTPEGSLQKLWSGIKTIFGDGKDAVVKKLTTFVDGIKDVKMFGPDGTFQKMWKSIKGFFGIGGKLATSAGFLMTAEEMVDLKHIGLHEDGPLKKMWKAIKGIFGKDGKIGKFVTEFIDLMNNPDMFGEKGTFRTAWKAIKGIFGAEGKIAKGFLLLKDAEDWVGEKSDTSKMFKWLGGLFGKEGTIAKNFATVKSTFGNYFGPSSPIDEIMKSFGTMFGPDSTLGKFISGGGDAKAPSGPGFIQKIKNIFSAEGTVGKLFGIFSGIGESIGGMATKIMDSAPVKAVKKIFGFAFKAGKVVAGAGGAILGTVGKWFAPIGWVMAIFEGIMGFWDGFKSKGEDDTRSMGDKIKDGLEGAINALIDFFVVDLLGIIESVINWGIGMLNKLPGVDMKEVSFAKDVGDMVKGVSKKALDIVMPDSEAAAKLVAKEGKMMDSMLKGVGGKFDKGMTDIGSEWEISGTKLAQQVKGMSVGELAAIQKTLEARESQFGVSSTEGEEWEKIIDRKIATLSDKERAMLEKMQEGTMFIQQNTDSSGGTTFSINTPTTDSKADKLTSNNSQN